MPVKLIAPVGAAGRVDAAGSTTSYTIAADRTVTVANADVAALLAAGFQIYQGDVRKVVIEAPVAADLVSIVAAATPANGAKTLAAQPVHARKLQVRIVIGTTTTTQITAGTATIVGADQDGNAVSEVISLVAAASVTRKTANAYASITSITLADYAADGSGTGNTFGVGVSNDFGVPTIPAAGGPVNFTLLKSTKITAVLGTSVTAADDVASNATVDAVARTIAPTTAPSASGLINFEFTYSFGAAA